MAKIELDFTGKFLDYNGNIMYGYNKDEEGNVIKVELEDINKFTGNALGNLRSETDSVRNDILAEKIYLEGKITVEEHDSLFIKKNIHSLKISDKLKRQILKAFK